MSRFSAAALVLRRLTAALRSSRTDGGAALQQQAPFISSMYVRYGPVLCIFGIARTIISMIFMDPTVQTSSVFSAEWGWTPYTGGALLILSGLLCVLTGVSTRRSHTNGFGFKKAALFSFFALFFFFASWLVYVLNAWGTADVLYEAGHSVFAIDEFFGVYGTYTFWIWTILYCVVVPLTYASFVLTGQTCLARMSRLGVLGGGNGGQLPLLANAAPIGAAAWVQQANVNANAPVVVAVATAMPVAQPYGGAVDVTSPVPVAKAYAADTEDMVG